MIYLTKRESKRFICEKKWIKRYFEQNFQKWIKLTFGKNSFFVDKTVVDKTVSQKKIGYNWLSPVNILQ